MSRVGHTLPPSWRPRGRAGRWAFVALAALLFAGGPLVVAFADPEECLECHGDPDFTTIRDGKEVSLYVDPKAYASSVHKGQDCVNCHTQLDGTDFPHAKNLDPVDCGECHDDEAAAYAKSIHGQALAAGDDMAPRCWDCHGSHHIRSKTDATSPTAILNIPALCGKCHREGSPVSRTHDIPQSRIFENYSQSIHGEGLYRMGLTVTAVCISCHTAHDILPHTDPNSTVSPERISTTCRKCHGGIEQVHKKVIEGRLWEESPGKIPVCVDCHAPHRQRRIRTETRAANDRCFECHGKDAYRTRYLERDGQKFSLYVDRDAYEVSTHGGTACAQCHSQVTPTAPERPCQTITSPVDCSVCHAEVVEQYQQSTHGKLAAKGDPDAPRCLDCHEKHATLSHKLPIAKTFPRNVPDLCSKCHRQGQKAAVRIKSDAPIVESYLMSIHGKGLRESGLVVTATCVSCHTAHGPLPASDPKSTVNDAHVADTCGACHNGIEEQFKKSIHWPGNGAATGRRLPTCKDCHTSHRIKRADRDDFRIKMVDQCGECHRHETETFFETVHGQSSRLKSVRSAKCQDCHGAHGILPPSDPNSTLSARNVVDTCGKCHTGAHRQFAGYLTHATHHDPKKYPWLFWTFWGMTTLLIGTLSVALVHTGGWLGRLWLTRDEWRRHKALARAAAGERVYRRFDRYQRTQHLVMILSFFTLAITGMALKFSYTSWAQGISTVIGFDAMSTLHRFGAVVLIGVFLTHLEYVRRKKNRLGRTWKQMFTGPDSILFNRNDLHEAWQSIKWFFGRGARPRYGRYTYWEKFDYMAVFWGVAVIGLTGLMRWFPELFTHVVPGWFINVAAIIHSDEALLAVGFIFTIHFFNTHFRPDKFPMDPVIFTGRVSVEELKYDKPREYERLLAEGRLDEHLVETFPEGATRAFRVFGFTMLAIGLMLIALIVVAMLVSYR